MGYYTNAHDYCQTTHRGTYTVYILEIEQKSKQEPSGYSKRTLVTQLVATYEQGLTEGTNIPLFIQMCRYVQRH